jgi:hypothetical protein
MKLGAAAIFLGVLNWVLLGLGLVIGVLAVRALWIYIRKNS